MQDQGGLFAKYPKPKRGQSKMHVKCLCECLYAPCLSLSLHHIYIYINIFDTDEKQNNQQQKKASQMVELNDILNKTKSKDKFIIGCSHSRILHNRNALRWKGVETTESILCISSY